MSLVHFKHARIMLLHDKRLAVKLTNNDIDIMFCEIFWKISDSHRGHFLV